MIDNQRHKFDIPADIAYFNCAYMSPLLKAVQKAGNDAIAAKAHPWTIAPLDFFTTADDCRSLFAEIINARPQDIAIVPSVSYGLAVAAQNLAVTSGDEILVLADQFPSNVYSWRSLAERTGAKIKTLTLEKTQAGKNEQPSWGETITAAISDKTALVALPHCHWTDGGLIDLAEVSRAAKAHEAALVLDITQSGGVLPINVAEIAPDFLVCACYKWLLGPYALGFLYVHPKWQDGQPLEQTWLARQGSEDFTRLIDYQDRYQPGAQRFDMGERSNFQLLPMAQAAMRQLLDWGVENIYRTLSITTKEIAKGAQNLGLLSQPIGARAGHYLGLDAPGGLKDDLTAQLAARKIYVSMRGSSLRVTPHLYNSQKDVDRLLDALEELM